MSTETKTIKYTFKQGVNRESTQYAAENGWYDSNRVRFRDQKPENIGGWVKRSSTAFDGTSIHGLIYLLKTISVLLLNKRY